MYKLIIMFHLQNKLIFIEAILQFKDIVLLFLFINTAYCEIILHCVSVTVAQFKHLLHDSGRFPYMWMFKHIFENISLLYKQFSTHFYIQRSIVTILYFILLFLLGEFLMLEEDMWVDRTQVESEPGLLAQNENLNTREWRKLISVI